MFWSCWKGAGMNIYWYCERLLWLPACKHTLHSVLNATISFCIHSHIATVTLPTEDQSIDFVSQKWILLLNSVYLVRFHEADVSLGKCLSSLILLFAWQRNSSLWKKLTFRSIQQNDANCQSWLDESYVWLVSLCWFFSETTWNTVIKHLGMGHSAPM